VRECDRTRQRLSEGIDNASVDDHLEGCEACRTYADALDAVRHHVPALVPGPPRDLAAAVHEQLGLAPPPAGPTAAAPGWRRFTRRTPAGVIAAIAGGLLGVVVVIALGSSGPAGDDAAATLTAVAESHAGQGTSYAFDIAGEAELRLPAQEATPGKDRLAAELGRLAGGRDDVELPPEVTVEYRAQGSTDGRGALAYELRWRVGAGARVDGSVEVVTVDDRTWMRTPATSDFVLLDRGVGFDMGVADVPHHLGEVLATLDDLEAAGTIETTSLGGQAVEHLRARTTGGLVVDAWVGAENGWLQRLLWIPPPPADERDGTTHGEVVVRLRDHGRTRFLGVPDDWRTLDEVADEDLPPFLPVDAG
jgi:hypothetical protein